MKPTQPSRRAFLKTSALAGLSAAFASSSTGCAATKKSYGGIASPENHNGTRPAGQKSVHDLTTKPLERIRVAVIGLGRGMSHVNNCLNIEGAEVVAVCDKRDDRANHAGNQCEKKTGKRPAVYSGNETIWEKMVEREDVDVVYIATPWEWHVPMCLRVMHHGKHAFVEVSAAVTVEQCWQLVDTSERTQRHCVLLENCCYGENELFVLNMARAGVFGELTHAECAYLHDLRKVLYALKGEGAWRREYHKTMNGNLYPTHGLGPVAQYLGIGRGDQFKFLVSMSSPEKSLTKHRDENQPNAGQHVAENYVCGDMNTSLIKTELGRTIMIQHDVVSPRPYSRINALYGTSATFFDYPARLAIDDPKIYGLSSKGANEWLDENDLASMRSKFTHPLWKKLEDRAAGQGHGGMDYVMNWRLLDCIRQGVTPDSVVYDAASWSSILELSTRSVASKSSPVNIPDFTRGLWKTMKPLGIVG